MKAMSSGDLREEQWNDRKGWRKSNGCYDPDCIYIILKVLLFFFIILLVLIFLGFFSGD